MQTVKRGFQPYARNAQNKVLRKQHKVYASNARSKTCLAREMEHVLIGHRLDHVTNSSDVIGHFLRTLRKRLVLRILHSLHKTLHCLHYVRLETALALTCATVLENKNIIAHQLWFMIISAIQILLIIIIIIIFHSINAQAYCCYWPRINVNITLFYILCVTLISKVQLTSDLDYFHAHDLPCSRVKSHDDLINNCRGDSAEISFLYIYSVSQKKVAPLKLCDIFSPGEPV